MTEPVQIIDKDEAAKTIEPLAMLVFQQLASEMGTETMQALLPIDIDVIITLRSGERRLVTATMGSRVESFNAVS
jgi:hypothetical protein